MKHDRIDASADAGFSLIELLVTLGLTAVIGAMMVAAIVQLRPIQAFQQRLDNQQMADRLVDVLAHDLHQIVKLPLLEGGTGSDALLKGEGQRIVFTAVVPTGFRRVGLREVTYELSGQPDKTRFRRMVRLRRFSQAQTGGLVVDELFVGALDLHLRYLVSTEEGRAKWQDDFREVNSLPEAISVSIKLGDGHWAPPTRIVSFAGKGTVH